MHPAVSHMVHRGTIDLGEYKRRSLAKQFAPAVFGALSELPAIPSAIVVLALDYIVAAQERFRNAADEGRRLSPSLSTDLEASSLLSGFSEPVSNVVYLAEATASMSIAIELGSAMASPSFALVVPQRRDTGDLFDISVAEVLRGYDDETGDIADAILREMQMAHGVRAE